MLLYILPVFLGLFIYTTDFHHTLIHRSERLYLLYKLVKNYKNFNNVSIIHIIKTTVNVVKNTLYTTFFITLNRNVKKLSNNHYEVSYVIRGKIYKMVIIPKKGPNEYVIILNENDIDVYDEIGPYMGPRYNFHHHPFTPKFWGYKELTFINIGGVEKKFTEDEIIFL